MFYCFVLKNMTLLQGKTITTWMNCFISKLLKISRQWTVENRNRLPGWPGKGRLIFLPTSKPQDLPKPGRMSANSRRQMLLLNPCPQCPWSTLGSDCLGSQSSKLSVSFKSVTQVKFSPSQELWCSLMTERIASLKGPTSQNRFQQNSLPCLNN